jgi:hypothetical protein
MIRIVKSIKAPKILTTRGVAQIQQDCAAYDVSPADYRSGEKTFNFDAKVYGAESVKKALRRAQYDKCCYCESKKFLATSYGAVEHYRPKGAVQQARGQKKSIQAITGLPTTGTICCSVVQSVTRRRGISCLSGIITHVLVIITIILPWNSRSW